MSRDPAARLGNTDLEILAGLIAVEAVAFTYRRVVDELFAKDITRSYTKDVYDRALFLIKENN